MYQAKNKNENDVVIITAFKVLQAKQVKEIRSKKIKKIYRVVD